jgi:hypothetical protein
MDENAFLGGAIAGLAYLAAGVRLIRLSWRTQERPDLLVGMSFFIWGLSYACWQIPIASADHPLTQPLYFAGRVLSHVGSIFFASFVWIAFRDRARWAKYLVFAIASGMIAGVAGSIAVGDWEGIRTEDNPWWLVDWAAGAVAMSWVGVEGILQYPKALKRAQLGLCDSLVCNRFLIWGITGAVWTAYSCIYLCQYVEFASEGFWSETMDRAIGGIELTGIALVWLIYFPPDCYRRWVAGAARAPQPEQA